MNNKIKILLVDDSDLRALDIEKFFDHFFYHCCEFNITKTTDESISILNKNDFDIIILDLNLPDLNDGANNSGGRKILSSLKINIDKKIIYLTSTEKTKEANIDIIEEDYLVMYKNHDDTWINDLKNIFLKRLNELNLSHFLHEKQYDIAIITALEDELSTTKKAISDDWAKYQLQDDNNIYFTTKIKNKQGQSASIIATNAHKMGMVHTAITSSKLLNKFNPKLLVMLGICAGKEGSVKIGEIIVAKKIFDYQAGKVEEDEDGKVTFKADYDERCLDEKYQSIIETFKSEFSHAIRDDWNKFINHDQVSEFPLPKVHIDSMASGSAVMSKKNIFEEINTFSRKVIALDMEGYAVFVGSNILKKNTTIPLVIKGVQDYAGNSKNDTYRKYAIYVAARFFYKLCEDSFIEGLVPLNSGS